MIMGVVAVIGPLRYEKFEFHPYMEFEYWQRMARTQRRIFYFGVVGLAFCLGMLVSAVAFGFDFAANVTPFRAGQLFWPTMLIFGCGIRARRIEQLLKREAETPSLASCRVTNNPVVPGVRCS